MSRNPDWTRDELILALDLYFQANKKQLDAKHPDVVQLSRTLNLLKIHGVDQRQTDFRNPQGVSMKLGNFLSLDPAYSGAGLRRGGKLDKQIWDEFSGDLTRLRIVAASIIKGINWLAESQSDYVTETIAINDEDEFPEGKVLTRLHKRRERNPKASSKKKQKVLKETGRLACEACGFDFVKVYGKIGQGFAECHHTVPVSELSEGHRTKLIDLAIVCSNCHRMLHKSRPMMSVNQLRELIMRNSHK